MVVWYRVKCWFRNAENVRFESCAIVFDDVIVFYLDVPALLVHVQVNCVNKMERSM